MTTATKPTKTVKPKTAAKVAKPDVKTEPKLMSKTAAILTAMAKAAPKKVAKKKPAPIVAPAALKTEFGLATATPVTDFNTPFSAFKSDPTVAVVAKADGKILLREAAPEPVAGVTVVATAKASAEKAQALVKDALGIDLDPSDQYFVTGTKMLAMGEDRLRELRAEYDALPTVVEACAEIVERIAAENRVDHTYRLADLTIDRDGLLVHDPSGQKFVVSAAAMAGLENRAPRSIESRLRANFNLWRNKPARNPVVKIRSRNPLTDEAYAVRHAFGAVTESYSIFDFDQIAAEIAKLMPEDAHATVRYEGVRGEIDVSLAPTLEVEEMGVGQVHRVHAIFRTADDGTQSIRALFAAERVRCINCTTLWDEDLMFSRMHVGEGLAEMVKETIAKASVALEKFSVLWKAANVRSMVDKVTGDVLSVNDCFKRLIAHGYVKTGEVKQPELLAMLQRAYDAEPLGGAAGINAAITRLAHEPTWQSPWTMQALEDQAGKLLFAEVYALPELTEEQEDKFAA